MAAGEAAAAHDAADPAAPATRASRTTAATGAAPLTPGVRATPAARVTTATIAAPATARTVPAPPVRRPRTDPETLEHIAMTLLRRYGVMFWRLLEREAAWLPAWRELLPVYHRLEARGEIRGGRFVAGLSGEQFALPEAIPLLREMRRRPHDGAMVCISAVDPLNLCGTLLAGDKVPALAGNRLLFRDGVLVATQAAGKFSYPQGSEERELLHAHLVGRS
jgi:ATP-dependent Lhr-like helicase